MGEWMASFKKIKMKTKKRGTASPRKTPKIKTSTRPVRDLAFSSPLGGDSQRVVYFLLTGLALAVAGIFSLPNFHMFLPNGGLLDHLLVHPFLLAMGFICLAAAYRQIPEAPRPAEIPRGLAYVGFAFFFGLCFFWRFYRPLQPSAPFWFDNQVVTGDIANIIDCGEHVLLFPWGQREPFFPT